MEDRITPNNENVLAETPQNTFCEKCGAQIAQNAEICPSCGCATKQEPREKTAGKRNPTNAKKIIVIALSAVVLVAMVVAGLFIWNGVRVAKVKEQLAGKIFSYIEYSAYSGGISYCKFQFDDEANCTYYYIYPHMSEGKEYEMDYTIKFKDGMAFLVDSVDRYYEIQYDKYGNIDSLYDITMKELYD